ncbi:response regulator transcription factor [Clostridium sp. OS1-26]|uniref:response regulator transcription factor n=1 Tax=Clostridium sp. OS1-26 TaxID=3070681 RepID=UPI0027E0BCF8|nr:response regulator transcription factor [Clostridium sp. OS1-26]WML32688.1 response regulator transcription factor [Clostridium sp. OS1-26]
MFLMKDKKILLVDDEPQLLKMVETIFRKDGFSNIYTASSCREAMEKLINHKPDIAVLDVMLPDGDGFSLINEFKRHYEIPVLFLTARGEAEDRLLGLGLGADDYIVKPFLPRELTLRLNAILKRTYASSARPTQPIIHLDCCTIDLGKAEVIKNNEKFYLTAKEHTILAVLYENVNKIVTIDTLCQRAWQEDSYGYENTLMVHIRHIREKIEENPSNPKSLVTVKGLGYTLLIKSR